MRDVFCGTGAVRSRFYVPIVDAVKREIECSCGFIASLLGRVQIMVYEVCFVKTFTASLYGTT